MFSKTVSEKDFSTPSLLYFEKNRLLFSHYPEETNSSGFPRITVQQHARDPKLLVTLASEPCSAYLRRMGCTDSLSLPQDRLRWRVQGNFGDLVRSPGEL